MTATIMCPECGQESPDYKLLCSGCGASLTGVAREDRSVDVAAQIEAQRAPAETEASPDQRTETGQTHLAYRIAAGVLFAGVLLNLASLAVQFALGIFPDIPAIVSAVIDLVLGIGLLQLRGGARQWVLIRAVLGAFLVPICGFVEGDILVGVVTLVIQWGYCGALILLLTGKSEMWRLVLAVGVYVVFTMCVSGAMLGLALLGSLL